MNAPLVPFASWSARFQPDGVVTVCDVPRFVVDTTIHTSPDGSIVAGYGTESGLPAPGDVAPWAVTLVMLIVAIGEAPRGLGQPWVIVQVDVSASPTAESVAVVPSNVSKPIVPDVAAVNRPSLPIVTGSKSDPFAVCVIVMVVVDAPVVCAGVPAARISPPDAVVISAVNVVSPADGGVVFAVSATYLRFPHSWVET